MECEMVAEMAAVYWFIDLHVVLTHILSEASSIASTSALNIGTIIVYGGSHPAAIIVSNEFKQKFGTHLENFGRSPAS